MHCMLDSTLAGGSLDQAVAMCKTCGRSSLAWLSISCLSSVPLECCSAWCVAVMQELEGISTVQAAQGGHTGTTGVLGRGKA